MVQCQTFRGPPRGVTTRNRYCSNKHTHAALHHATGRERKREHLTRGTEGEGGRERERDRKRAIYQDDNCIYEEEDTRR